MIRFYYIIKKEALEIARDYPSFLVLIVMPVVFILVMSLSMQALFQSHSRFKIRIYAINSDGGPRSKNFIDRVRSINNLSLKELDASTSPDELAGLIIDSDYRFAIILNKTFSRYVNDLNSSPAMKPVSMLCDPAMQAMAYQALKNQIEMELARMRMDIFFAKNAEITRNIGLNAKTLVDSIGEVVVTDYVYKNKTDSITPNATQQSVPAWLVFSMYFLVFPISTIFHTEKASGTIQRLRSINVGGGSLIAGKITAYYIISMIQVAAMLCVGRYVVPLLGGDGIHLGSSHAGLFIIATCVSVNAISYGLFLSLLSKNVHVASGAGAVLTIILAAIGGIMVPKFVMPEMMQKLAGFSPLGWGMEGFLDIILRNGSVADVLPECCLLTGTAGVMLALTAMMLKRKVM
ncbi:MAG TPA: ABC transporter permease [Spirochaetota bacterium]|nr:ABC transporter permease [Spirochaetota bacterium]HRZ26483.1 ABC transporter permease [Spirochaetota bacterium]HSA15803.1 ABC transporter permease [Spirochaetota bacterium]